MNTYREDPFLQERLARYDRWIREGRIPYSSKVVPVREALDTQQWVLPTEQVLAFLQEARVFVLVDCDCRSHYQRCDHPVETCFLLDEAAEASLEQGLGRRVSLTEAESVLRQANQEGLVHLTIYNPQQQVYAVCSCCTCCCHDLQFLQVYGRDDMIAYSEYVAHTDWEGCIHCGVCVERCVFGARRRQVERIVYRAEACYGCGLCVTVCPTEATNLIRR